MLARLIAVKYCHKGIGPGGGGTGRGQRVGALRFISDLNQPRVQERRRGNVVFEGWHIGEM